MTTKPTKVKLSIPEQIALGIMLPFAAVQIIFLPSWLVKTAINNVIIAKTDRAIAWDECSARFDYGSSTKFIIREDKYITEHEDFCGKSPYLNTLQ